MVGKKLVKIILIILLFLPLIAAAHFFIFPQETRCMLINFANFKSQQNLYYRKNVPPDIIPHLLKIKTEAEEKVRGFWKNKSNIKYKLIYCDEESDYKIYGSEGTPAVTYRKMGAYVVITNNMFDVNILSHEISHTVLYRQIGWYKLHFEIPAWFDEGLAMQVDDRDYYSIDTLLKNQNTGTTLPDVTQMINPEKFLKGSTKQIMLNYSTAKYIVHQWLKKNSLSDFIESINKGNSFESSYKKQ